MDPFGAALLNGLRDDLLAGRQTQRENTEAMRAMTEAICRLTATIGDVRDELTIARVQREDDRRRAANGHAHHHDDNQGADQ